MGAGAAPRQTFLFPLSEPAAEVWHFPDDLPRAAPRTVCGIELDEIESGRFEQALKTGELVISCDMPVNSPLPKVWERWCKEQHIPCVIRDDTEP